MPKIRCDFWQLSICSQISPERINIWKIGKVLDQLHFIDYWAKKFGERWSTKNTVIDAYVDPPNWTLSKILNFGP